MSILRVIRRGSRAPVGLTLFRGPGLKPDQRSFRSYAMHIRLEQDYVSRDGTPIVSQVDPAIFSLRYFAYCLDCTFCHDVCCSYGAEIDVENVKRLEVHADA